MNRHVGWLSAVLALSTLESSGAAIALFSVKDLPPEARLSSPAREPPGWEFAPRSLHFTSDSKQLITPTTRGITVWDLKSRIAIQRFSEDNTQYPAELHATFAPVSEQLYVARGRSIQKWQRSKSAWICTDASYLRLFWMCSALALNKDGSALSIGTSHKGGLFLQGEFPMRFKLLGTKEGTDVAIDHDSSELLRRAQISSLCYSPNDQFLCVTFEQKFRNKEEAVLLSVRENYKVVKHLAFPFGPVCASAFSSDGKLLAVAGGELSFRSDRDRKLVHGKGGVAIWQIDDDKPPQTLTVSQGQVKSLAFSHDGKWLVTGGEDRTVRIWEIVTGKLKRTLVGYSGPVTAIAFSPDGKQFATGSEDTSVVLWDLTRVIGPGAVR
jgi:WD40 repeat protein